MPENYTDIGSGYYQDPTTGKVYRKNPTKLGPAYLDAESPEEDKIEQRFAEKRQLARDLSKYDEYTREFRDVATSDFKRRSEYLGAQQIGATMAGVGLEGARRGLGEEFTGALTSEATTRLRSQVLGGQLSFEQAINLNIEDRRLGFLEGTLDFFRDLQKMRVSADIQKDLLRFQAELQKDLQSQSLFGDMLELGATVLGTVLLGPIGGAAVYGSSEFAEKNM